MGISAELLKFLKSGHLDKKLVLIENQCFPASPIPQRPPTASIFEPVALQRGGCALNRLRIAGNTIFSNPRTAKYLKTSLSLLALLARPNLVIGAPLCEIPFKDRYKCCDVKKS